MVKNWKKYSANSWRLLLFGLCLLHIQAWGQTDYFQQRANYRIDVRLNDTAHSLDGVFGLVYVNHSPDTLKGIYFHLWMNAFSGNQSAYNMQNLQMGSADFHFSKDSQRGYIDSLDFSVNGVHANLQRSQHTVDIAYLPLPDVLLPGDSVYIRSPFYVKLPDLFCRPGHYEQAYYVTQWYPKPAVYDEEGWHVMPYLSMGEFYSEYGNYDVTISLPANYSLAASGGLANTDEKKCLLQAAENPDSIADNSFPRSINRMKTLRYKAKNVHDFAWFADKRFLIGHKSIEITGRDAPVDVWAYYLPESAELWEKATGYIASALRFYSEELGPYPYPSCTAVLSDVSDIGGMEYPGVTLISDITDTIELERTIMHEVGHNWFYSILGFDERRYPWLDEGLNSFYEIRYMERYYPKRNLMQRIPISLLEKDLVKYPERYVRWLAYVYTRSIGIDQPAGTPSADFYMMNYGTVVYFKTPLSLYYLNRYLGEDRFKDIMQSFYQKWKFRHPGPENLRQHFDSCTDTSLDWFFDGLIQSTDNCDYYIESTKNKRLKICNRGDLASPVYLEIDSAGQWIEGFKGCKEVPLPENWQKIQLDPDFFMTDLSRDKHVVQRNEKQSVFDKLSVRPLIGKDRPDTHDMFFIPALGYNLYDGFMPGIALYNTGIPVKSFEYQVLPLYSFRRNQLNGMYAIDKTILPQTTGIRSVRFRHSGQHFSLSDDADYYRFILEARMRFKTKTLKQEHEISLRQYWNTDLYNSGQNTINLLSWKYASRLPVNPYKLSLSLEQGKGFVKTYLNAGYRLNYTKKRGMQISLFAGKFLQYEDDAMNVNFRLSGTSGWNDYRYDHLFFGRTEQLMNPPASLFAHQFIMAEGGFALYTPLQANDWMLSLRLETSIALPVIHLYANAARYNGLEESLETPVVWEAGVKFQIIREILSVYIPIMAADEIKEINEAFYSNNFFQKIRFHLSLKELNLFEYRTKPAVIY